MTYQRKYDFRNGTVMDAEQVDEELNQIISALNTLLNADASIRSLAQMKKITLDNGAPKLSITDATKNLLAELKALGIGEHTFYAIAGTVNLPPSGVSIRGKANFTSDGFGWVEGFDANNQVWSNVLSNDVWSGWNPLSFVDIVSFPRNSEVYAAKSTDQSIAHGVYTKVGLQTELTDIQGEFATQAFTPKTTGAYLVITNTIWNSASSGDIYHDIWENGAQLTHNGVGYNAKVCSYSRIVHMDKDKKYEFYVQQYNSNSANTLSAAQLFIYKLG